MSDLMTRPLSPLTDLSDDDNNFRCPSQLTDAFVKTVLDHMDEMVPTEDLQEGANAQLLFFESVPEERRILQVGNKNCIDTLLVLREMLNNAPTDWGTRYVASAVICCDYCEEGLFKLASDFLNFLLWPCTSQSVSYFLAHRLLAVRSSYKSKTPTVSEYSTITIPETEASMTVVSERRDSRFLQLVCFCSNDNLILMSRTAQRATGG